MEDPYKIHDVTITTSPFFNKTGHATRVTRVTMYIGPHGPFTEDFGEGQARPATPDAIRQWQTEQVSLAMTVAPKG